MSVDESLDTLGERRLVAEVLARRYRETPGFGDDCAVVPLDNVEGVELVATTDPCPTPLVASLGWDDLYFRGWLLAVINLSDLAAAGARPAGLMVSYVLPGKLSVLEFERLVSGVDDSCQVHGTRVLGGNLGDGPAVHLTATAIGRCSPGERLGRRGAQAGDVLLLLGSPGYLWATALLRLGHASLPRAEEQAVFDRALHPRAQTAAGVALAQARLAKAAMDVSDGLYASVSSLCEANGLGAEIIGRATLDPPIENVCRQASVDAFDLAQLWGDWSLLVAVAPERAQDACDLAATVGSAAQPIGVMTATPGVWLEWGGQRDVWVGVESERFTPSSWRSDLVGEYVTRLRSG